MKRFILLSTLLLLLLLTPVQAQDVPTVLLQRVNQLRASRNLPAYTLNSALTVAANNQARWMIATGAVSHIQDNGSTPRSRAAAAGYGSSWVGENIYIGGLATIDSAMEFWINSPVHYRGMTSNQYREIGIGYAAGDLKAFVLVFGNPGGQAYVAPQPPANPATGASNNNTNSAAAAPVTPPQSPPYVLGVNEDGFIMHEIQSGDTVGDVAFLYGYGWSDIATILSINGMNENDVFDLVVGEVLLIPPYDGTFTPTPENADSTQVTPPPDSMLIDLDVPTMTLSPQPSLSPTITPTPSETPFQLLVTEGATATIESALADPVTYIAPSATPSMTATPISTATATAEPTHLSPSATTIKIAALSTAPAEPGSIEDDSTPVFTTPPLWLVLAMIVQAGILLFAVLELIRRRLKSP